MLTQTHYQKPILCNIYISPLRETKCIRNIYMYVCGQTFTKTHYQKGKIYNIYRCIARKRACDAFKTRSVWQTRQSVGKQNVTRRRTVF